MVRMPVVFIFGFLLHVGSRHATQEDGEFKVYFQQGKKYGYPMLRLFITLAIILGVLKEDLGNFFKAKKL